MALQFTPYTVPVLVTLVVLAAVASYAYRIYRDDGSRVAFYLSLTVGVGFAWAVGTLVVLTVTSRFWKLAATYEANVVTAFVPLVWVLFALAYADHWDLVTHRRLALFLVEPLVVTVTTLTNFEYGLMYRELYRVGGGFTTVAGPVYLERTPGLLWYGHALYSYLLVALGSYIIIRTVLNSKSLYRWQGGLMIVGAVVPLAANVAFVSGVLVPDPVNLTPIALSVTGLAFTVAIFRYRFLDLVPVARDSVVESMSDGYVVLDDDNLIVDLNAAAEGLVGVDAADALGTPFADAVPTCAHLVDDDALADGGEVQDEVVFQRDGEERFVDVSVSPIADDGLLVFLRDVTDRRRVEKRYQRLIEQSSDLITVLDSDGVVRYQSPSAERVLGYAPGELVGDSAFDYVHPDDREAMVAEFSANVAESGSETRIEYRFRHADGSWLVLESVGRNLLDDPFVEGVVVNSRDVTERRRQEAELRAANERLDQFASVVSHDLRNPLNVAEGHLELVREGHEDSVDEVAESHGRMRRIIEDVLTVAREGGAVEEPEPVVLAAVARDAWEAVDTTDATLDTPTESVVQADRSRLQQLLENVVRNAVEHGATSPRSQAPEDAVEHGGADVTVTVADAPGGFTVSDDGTGVDDDTLDSMFEEGFSTNETGTGLGLSIVQTIAEGHGWTVTAEHAPEGGVRLRFEDVTREQA